MDAAAIMVDRAYTAWKNCRIGCMLPKDIKAAFRSVAKGRLATSMTVRKMDRDHMQ